MLIFESKNVKTLGIPIILHKRDSTSFRLLKTKIPLWVECIVYKIYQMKKICYLECSWPNLKILYDVSIQP